MDYLLQLLYLYAHELVHIVSTTLLFCLSFVILLCIETRMYVTDKILPFFPCGHRVSFFGSKNGRDVALATHSLLEPRLKKGHSYNSVLIFVPSRRVIV